LICVEIAPKKEIKQDRRFDLAFPQGKIDIDQFVIFQRHIVIWILDRQNFNIKIAQIGKRGINHVLQIDQRKQVFGIFLNQRENVSIAFSQFVQEEVGIDS
jgi:hypothetical protein